MHRVHQGLASAILPVKQFQILTGDFKDGNTALRVRDPDPAKASAFGQDKCPNEDVRGLVMLGDRASPPFTRQD